MKRHRLTTRLWHWTNAAALIVLFMSGLNISNAHPRLYWGDYGFEASDAWLTVVRFPGWATLPQYYSLAIARDWHTLAAWVFALALLFGWAAMLVNGHFRRDLSAKPAEFAPKALYGEVVGHLRGNFDAHGGKYNSLQKISYGIVLGIFLPMMILTGLAISPGIEPAAPWMVDLLGGRQSARSLHFIFAWLLFAFFVVHIVMVLLSGPIKQVTEMITGGRIEEGHDE